MAQLAAQATWESALGISVVGPVVLLLTLGASCAVALFVGERVSKEVLAQPRGTLALLAVVGAILGWTIGEFALTGGSLEDGGPIVGALLGTLLVDIGMFVLWLLAPGSNH